MKYITIILNIIVSLFFMKYISSPDIIHYENWYNSNDYNTFLEPGFNLFSFLSNFISFDFFLILLVIINTNLISFGLYRYSNSNFNVFFVFLCLPFLALNSGITIRQNLAIGLFLNSNYLLSFMSPFFHVSALPALLVSRVKFIKRYKKWIFLFVLILIYLTYNSIIKILFSEVITYKLEIYSGVRESSSIRVFLWIIFLIYFIKLSKNKLLNTYASISILFIALSYFNPQLQRISWFFIPIIMMMMLNQKQLTYRKIISLTFLLVNFIYFLI